MKKGIRYESIQEPLDDEERALMDSDNWDWDNPIEIEVADEVQIRMPIEVSFEEFGLLEHVARAEGRTPHAFMKQAALDAARAMSPDYISPRINHQSRARRSG
jgi:hypothetical protein